MALLVGAFGDDSDDAPGVEERSLAAAAVGPVGQQRIGSGPGPDRTAPGHPQVPKKRWELSAVAQSGLDD